VGRDGRTPLTRPFETLPVRQGAGLRLCLACPRLLEKLYGIAEARHGGQHGLERTRGFAEALGGERAAPGGVLPFDLRRDAGGRRRRRPSGPTGRRLGRRCRLGSFGFGFLLGFGGSGSSSLFS